MWTQCEKESVCVCVCVLYRNIYFQKCSLSTFNYSNMFYAYKDYLLSCQIGFLAEGQF